jgi:hypothetical protein
LEIRDTVNKIVVDPSRLETAMGDPDAWRETPNVARERYLTAARGIAYLKQVEPRTFKPLFGGTELVDPVAIARYERAVEAVRDPYGVLDKLWSGGVATEHIDALDAVYPRIMQRLRGDIMDEVGTRAHANRPIDYRARSKLGQLLRMPLDDTQRPNMFAALQLSIAPPPKPDQGAAQANPQGRGSVQIEDMKAEQKMTESERRESGIDRA